MLQIPNPRQFVEGLIEGLLQFIISLVRSWTVVALRPVRGAVELASDRKALSSRSTLFVASVVASTSSTFSLRNVAEAIQGARLSPATVNTPWYSGYDQSGGVLLYVVWALLIFAFYEVASYCFAWMFSRGSRPRKRFLVHLFRYIFAPTLVIAAILNLIISSSSDYGYAIDYEAMEVNAFLVRIASWYPLFIAIIVLARKLRRKWLRPLLSAYVVLALYLPHRYYSEAYFDHVLNRAFVPDVNTHVESLRCSVRDGDLHVEAILFNSGSRPIVLDERLLSLVIVGPPWTANASGYDEPRAMIDPRTGRVRYAPDVVPPQTLYFKPERMEVMAPNAMTRFAATATPKPELEPHMTYYCRLKAESWKLGIRSFNALVTRDEEPAGSAEAEDQEAMNQRGAPAAD